jgi:hypothetical protein
VAVDFEKDLNYRGGLEKTLNANENGDPTEPSSTDTLAIE